MNLDDMRRGVIPGMLAGYIFLAYAGLNPAVSFAGHFFVSLIIGALYAGVFTAYLHFGSPLINILAGGLIYGLTWWIVGWNIILPLLNGDPILQIHFGTSFYGHIIFGHTLAFVVFQRDAAMGMFWGNYSYGDYSGLPKREHPAGYVYHASTASRPGQVKIGRTNDPDRRLGELKRDFGKDMRYSSIRTSDNAPRDEKRLHRRLSPLRKMREFFDIF